MIKIATLAVMAVFYIAYFAKQILGEEKFLEKAFGEDYIAY